MLERLRKHHISFKNAIAGIVWAFQTQPNFLVHSLLAVLVLVLGYILQVHENELLILIFAIIFCLGCEMINTSIEAMTDLISKEWRKDAKIAKDVSAGMMLLSAFGAFIIGCIIFIPKLLHVL